MILLCCNCWLVISINNLLRLVSLLFVSSTAKLAGICGVQELNLCVPEQTPIQLLVKDKAQVCLTSVINWELVKHSCHLTPQQLKSCPCLKIIVKENPISYYNVQNFRSLEARSLKYFAPPPLAKTYSPPLFRAMAPQAQADNWSNFGNVHMPSTTKLAWLGSAQLERREKVNIDSF